MATVYLDQLVEVTVDHLVLCLVAYDGGIEDLIVVYLDQSIQTVVDRRTD